MKAALLVMAGLDPAIHDEVQHAMKVRMDHRVSHRQATRLSVPRMAQAPAQSVGRCGPVMTRVR
jgi:hypothetical protein